MGIRFYCPNGHKLNVKNFQAGRRGVCPHCGVSMEIPTESTRPSSKELGQRRRKKRSEAIERKRSKRTAGQQPAAEPSPAMQVAAAVPPSQSLRTDSSQPTGNRGNGSAVPFVPVRAPQVNNPLEEFPEFAATQTHVAPAPVQRAATAQSAPASTAKASPLPPTPVAPSGEADPLAEAPDVVWYVRPPSGGQFGPATRDIMRVWIAEGRVSPDSLVWREGWRDWQEAGDVFPQLSPARPADAVPGLKGIMEEEYASPRPATGAHRSSDKSGSDANSMLVIWLVIGLVLLVLVVIVLWAKFGGSDKQPEKAAFHRPPAILVAEIPAGHLPYGA